MREYFGDGDECHMAYHFPLMPRMYMAIAQEDRHPVVEIMQQTPDIPENCQWAIFLRNHDELTLEMVTSKERDYMYRMYAADPRARINLGIRRRLAPLMENDIDRIKLMNSLLLSMPGSPIVYYGDEIGMGDNIFLGDRNGVRTPMQWSPDRNAGFSRADPQRLYLPPIMDPVYGYEAVNVEAQTRDPALAAELDEAHARGAQDEPGVRPRPAHVPAAGQPQGARVPARARRRSDPVRREPRPLGAAGRARPRALPRTRAGRAARAARVSADRRAPVHADAARARLLLVPARDRRARAAAGTRSASRAKTCRSSSCSTAGRASSATASCRGASPWRRRSRDSSRPSVLPRYLESQRWYAAKGETIKRARLADHVPSGRRGRRSWMIARLDIEGATERAEPAKYFLPLALAWEDEDEALVRALAPVTLARVRQQANVGVLADALGDEAFCRALVEAIGARRGARHRAGTVRFVPTHAFAELAGDATAGVTGGPPAGAEQQHDRDASASASSSRSTASYAMA